MTPFHVSEYIQEAMDARGWDLEDLALRMGTEAEYGVNLLTLELTFAVAQDPKLAMQSYMGEKTANALGRAFGSDPQTWLRLDAAYRTAMKAAAN